MNLIKSKLEQAFLLFDIVITILSLFKILFKDKDGFISIDEVQQIMGGILINNETWSEFISSKVSKKTNSNEQVIIFFISFIS